MSLPSGYTRLEYIKSSGTQYINTGFNPNQNTRVVVDAKPLSVTQAQLWCIFGVRTSVFFELYKASTRNMRLTFLYGSTYTQGFDSLDYTKRQTFEINKNREKTLDDKIIDKIKYCDTDKKTRILKMIDLL